MEVWEGRCNDTFVALEWRAEESRIVGRPKTTWRRVVEKERNRARRSWNEEKVAANQRTNWKDDIVALCTFWHRER